MNALRYMLPASSVSAHQSPYGTPLPMESYIPFYVVRRTVQVEILAQTPLFSLPREDLNHLASYFQVRRVL